MPEQTALSNLEVPRRPGLAATIGRNAIVVTLAGWVLKGLNFAYFIAVARLLGDEHYGLYMTGAAVVGMTSVFMELGLTQYVERALAQDRSRLGVLLGNLIALRLVLAIVGLVAIPLTAALVGYDSTIVRVTALIAGTFIPSAFLYPLSILITSAERYDLSAPLQIAAQLIANLCGLVALLAGFGLSGLLLAGYIALPAQIVLTIWTIRRHNLGPIRLQIRPRTWPALLGAALPFGLTSLALSFNFNADTAILGRLVEPSHVGWYNVAYGLVFRLVALADGILLTMTVSLAREQVHNPAAVRAWSAAALRWLLLFALPSAVGLSLLATPIMALLYGPEFAAAAPLLALIAWDIPLVLFTAFCGNLSAAVGRERPAAAIYLLSAGLNFGLNLTFIPIYGVVAAAWITLFTDGLTALLFLIVLRHQLALARLADAGIRMGIAAGLMAVVVLLTRDLLLLVPIIMGAAVYLVLAVGFKLIAIAQLRELWQRMRLRLRWQ